MTETEWLQCDNPTLIFNYLFQHPSRSDRKVRLFACACCRKIWHLLTDERSRRAIEITELHVDGATTPEELVAALAQAKKAWTNARLWLGHLEPGEDKALAAREAEAFHVPVWVAETEAAKRDRHWIAAIMVMANQALVCRLPGSDQERHAERLRERQRSCVLLHDVFGNPFRPVAVDPSWVTAAVVEIARAVYDEWAFHRMPELAVALAEAGCDNADILAHCRQPGEHVRGCWVVDLLLGRK